jgi:hypothetical protein
MFLFPVAKQGACAAKLVQASNVLYLWKKFAQDKALYTKIRDGSGLAEAKITPVARCFECRMLVMDGSHSSIVRTSPTETEIFSTPLHQNQKGAKRVRGVSQHHRRTGRTRAAALKPPA